MAIASSTDFTGSAGTDAGITVVRTPVTKTISATGSETLTEGSTNNITGAIFNPSLNQYVQERLGLMQNTTAYLVVSGSETINKEDKITAQGNNYRVINVRERTAPAGTVSIYKFCELKLIN